MEKKVDAVFVTNFRFDHSYIDINEREQDNFFENIKGVGISISFVVLVYPHWCV